MYPVQCFLRCPSPRPQCPRPQLFQVTVPTQCPPTSPASSCYSVKSLHPRPQHFPVTAPTQCPPIYLASSYHCVNSVFPHVPSYILPPRQNSVHPCPQLRPITTGLVRLKNSFLRFFKHRSSGAVPNITYQSLLFTSYVRIGPI